MKSILIADDRPETRELVRVTLSGEGFRILEASNGVQALEAARREKPDLLILDVMMPGGMDGYQVCKKIKSDAQTCSTVVLMLSAKNQAIDRETGLQCGADDYFTKPFSPLQLLDKIDRTLNSSAD